MFIRCAERCHYQDEGYCSLNNTYSAEMSADTNQISEAGCIYYKPKEKTNRAPQKIQPRYYF